MKVPVFLLLLPFLFLAGPGWCQDAGLPTPPQSDSLTAELGCVQCHVDLPGPSRVRDQAPDLGHAGFRYRAAYLLEFLQNPRQVRRHIGRARMPSFHLTEAEALALTLHLGTLRQLPSGWPERPASLRVIDQGVTRTVSRAEFDRELDNGLACLTCHTLQGRGGVLGPELADVGYQLQPGWIASYLVAPEQFGVPANLMPAQFYQLSADRQRFEPIQPDADRRIVVVVGYLAGAGTIRLQELERKLARAKQAHPAATADAGEQLFRALNCAACHRHPTIAPRSNAAPDLSSEGRRVQPEWLARYLKNPTALRRAGYQPGDASRMPDFRLQDDEAGALSAFLASRQKPLTPSNPAWSNTPLSAFARAKAQALLENKLSCLGCHRLGGQGGVLGPDLSRVKSRLQPEYVHNIIANPTLVAPHSIMPKLPLARETFDLLARHLLQSDWASPDKDPYLSPLDHPSLLRVTAIDPNPPARVSYVRHCAPCHGAEGRGDGFNAPFLQPAKPAVLADRDAMKRRPDDTLFDGIHSGGAILNRSHWMPAWGGTLSGPEIRGLVRYLRGLCQCEGPEWARDGNSR